MIAKRFIEGRSAAKLRRSKHSLRKGLVEKLEDRNLMASDWNPSLVASTGFFRNQADRAATINYVANHGATSGSGSGGVQGPEGAPTNSVSVSEVEPNNSFSQAQQLPVSTSTLVTLIGSNTNPFDEDWVSFNLNAGDILDARLNSTGGGLPLLSLYDSSNVELIAMNSVATQPAASPLTGSITAPVGTAAVSTVISHTGKHFFRISDAGGAYTVTFTVYRPVLESQPVGTVQTLYLDFDGAAFPRNLFGFGPGTVRLSPFARSLAQWGLTAGDEPALINEITQRTIDKFDFLRQNSTNSNVQIRIINNRNSTDPWGAANVSRVIVGGTLLELAGPGGTPPAGLIGIAESVDVGNFDTTETAIVMMDVLTQDATTVDIAGNVTRIQYIAELIASVIAHEAGHFFGGLHQEPLSTVNGIMDQFYDPFVFSGAGVDQIFGTRDDERLNFAVDDYVQYTPATPTNGRQPLAGGVDDTINAIGWALTPGAVGGRINGNVFNDRNLSRTRDAGDLPLSSVRVYTDINGNSVFDSNEFSAFSDSAGNYSIVVTPGTYTVREVVPAGFRLTTPLTGFHRVTISGTNTVGNINFGQEQLSLNATGLKWNDVNGNALRDPGEGVIPGVRFYVDLDGDERIDIGEPSAKSNEFGQYSLTFPGTGTFRVREVVEPGYVQTFPSAANNFEHTVTVTGNPAVDTLALAGLNFGNKLTVDFGDAPATFGEASAGFKPGLLLGANWDDEQTSQFSANALGDDGAGQLDANDVVIDDEDGVVFTRPLVAGLTNNSIAVTAVNSTGFSAYLSGWIDFNRDGDFNDSGEQVFTNTVIASGATSLTFAAPANASLGTTFARFRYSNERDVPVSGRSLSGEVEDYLVNIVASLDLAVNDRFSVTRNSVLNILDVLANDFSLPGEQLEIASTSGSVAGGVVQISANNQILYTPPAGFVGQDSFNYTMRNSAGETDTASVTVDVRLFFADPVAVDDSFDIAVNAIDVPLNVLANDIEGQAGALTIIMVTQPDGGGQISISSGGKSLRYTPVRGFNGTESFSYTVADSNGKQSTARVTLHTLPYVNSATDVVYSLRTTDLTGNEISAIQQGQDFKLDVYVDDFRNDRGAPSNAPGVFAAYLDLLYNLQLVSTAIPQGNNSLNFDVNFSNGYTNGLSGDATIPGLIDEFGAFFNTGSDPNNPGTMNFPDTVRVASITFTARSPGIAKFSSNPADVSPLNDTLLFDLPGSSVPLNRIRFLTTTLEIVGNSDEFPFAVDDSLSSAIPFGATRFPINVKANDFAGSTGIINVVSTTQGQNGSTLIDPQGRVLYTPNGGFTGADQFSYTIEDSRGIRSQATVTVRVGAADSNDIVELRLDVTDINGVPITTIAVGGQFQLRGYVKDLRSARPNQGVFAAYQDVLYSGNLVSPKAKAATVADPLGFEIVFGTNYQQVISGDITNRGIINELGAVQNGDLPLGAAEQLLFIVTLDAKAVGTATFIGDPADIRPLHDTLTFDPAAPVGFDLIRYGADSINITSSGSLGGGEFTNQRDRHDVNNDGFVTPIDALIVINHLNANAGGSIAGGGEGESGRYYIDVSGDNVLSPLDALLVINRLNSSRFGAGEGEGEGSSATASAADSVFGEESSMDQLLTQLAPDLEELRKKR